MGELQRMALSWLTGRDQGSTFNHYNPAIQRQRAAPKMRNQSLAKMKEKVWMTICETVNKPYSDSASTAPWGQARSHEVVPRAPPCGP